MEFQVEEHGLPDGVYPGIFTGIEEWEGQNQYGPACFLIFRLTDGEHRGKVEKMICSMEMKPNKPLYRMAEGLKGKPLIVGERFNFADFVSVNGAIEVRDRKIVSFVRQSRPTQEPPQGLPDDFNWA